RPVLRGGEAGRAVRPRAAGRVPRGPRGRRAHPRAAARARRPPLRTVSGRGLGGVIEVQVTRLRDDAVLPTRAYAGDAGLDLVACERHELAPGERALVGTGIAVAIPEGHAGLVTPRSGLATRYGVTIVNT